MSWKASWTKSWKDSWTTSFVKSDGGIVPNFGLLAWYDFTNANYLVQ